MESGKHFILVHGAGLGAWCWYKVMSPLKLAGHKVTALDLGASGANPKRLDEIVSVSDYMQPLMEFMASLPPDKLVILVGHSYGGLCIALVMEKFPERVALAVFISAYMPNCNSPPGTLIQKYFSSKTPESVMDCQFQGGIGQPPSSVVYGPKFMETKLYRNCNQEDLELAKALVRPSRLFMEDLMDPEFMLTEAKFGSIRRLYVVCEEDEVMEEEFQRYMIEMDPPEEVKLVKGSGHMVMISKPAELGQVLEEIAVTSFLQLL